MHAVFSRSTLTFYFKTPCRCFSWSLKTLLCNHHHGPSPRFMSSSHLCTNNIAVSERHWATLLFVLYTNWNRHIKRLNPPLIDWLIMKQSLNNFKIFHPFIHLGYLFGIVINLACTIPQRDTYRQSSVKQTVAAFKWLLVINHLWKEIYDGRVAHSMYRSVHTRRYLPCSAAVSNLRRWLAGQVELPQGYGMQQQLAEGIEIVHNAFTVLR